MSTTETESSALRERFASVQARITELEKEAEGVMEHWTTAKRIEGNEAFTVRLLSLLREAWSVIHEYNYRDNVGIEEPDLGDPRPDLRNSLTQLLARVVQYCDALFTETVEEDHKGDDHQASSASGSGMLGTDGEDQSRTSRISQIAPEMEVKKTFLQWLEDDKTVSDHKEGVVELGTRLSLMIVDFFFRASKGDILEIVGTFRTALEAKSRFADKKSSLVVVEIFSKLLDFGEEEARKLERIESESSSGLIIKAESAAGIVDMLIEQILNLEAFVNKMLMSREAIADAVRLGVDECRAQLEGVGAQVSQQRLLLLSLFKEVPESVASLRKRMESKARELWSGFGLDKKED